MKFHFNNALNPEAFPYAACGARGAINMTVKKSQVTCRRCLKMLKFKKQGGEK